MPLNFTIQQAPLRFGLAEGIDPHQVPFGTVTEAENLCWDKSGRIQKRRGVTALSTGIVGGGNLTTAKRLVVRGQELALTDGQNLYAYTPSGWVNRGAHPEFGIEWYTSIDTVTGVATCDMAVLSSGYVVEAWVSGDPGESNTPRGTLYYQIRDTATKTMVVAPVTVDTTVMYGFRLLSNGTSWALVYATGAGNVKYFTTSGTVTLKTDFKTADNCNIEACLIGTDFVYAYPTTGTDIRLVRASFVATPVEAANVQMMGETAYAIAIAGALGEPLYVTWSTSLVLRASVRSASALTAISAPATIETPYFGATMSLVRYTSTSALLLYSDPVGAGYTKSVTISSMGSVTTGQKNVFMRPMSKPFQVGARWYCVLATEIYGLSFTVAPIATSDTFLADVTFTAGVAESYRLVGKIDAFTGGAYAFQFLTTPNIVSSTEVSVAVGYQSSINTSRGGMRQGIRYVRITSGASLPPDTWRSVAIGPETYMAAGVLTSYDGMECLGYGWPHGPYLDPANCAPSTTGGFMAAGNYLYNVTAERRSAVGVLHRSPVGLAQSFEITTGSTGSVVIGVVAASLGHSQRNPGQFPIYRSIVDGSVPQREAIEPSFMTLIDRNLPYPATITDVSNDALIGSSLLNLGTRPALYTVGGELEDTQPCSALTLTTYQNRIWMVAGDGRTVWFSKDYTENPGIAPGFYPTNSLAFEEPVTALCAMDWTLIAFGTDTCSSIIGAGPAPNGAGSTYEVGVIQTDVGCTNPRSVVSMPLGVIFQSSRGLHLVSRKLEASWIGRPVQDKLAAYPNITSAVLVAAKNEVRWTANNALGTAGIVIVYNYVEDQWSTSKYTVGGVYGAPIADACMWNGVWTFVTPSGQVCCESSTSCLDGTTWVPITLETAWVCAGGPLAYQAVRNFAIEGISNSNHDLTVSVGFDNETAYTQSRTFLAGSPVTSIGPLESCEISIGTRRKCQAIRFKVQDATPTNPGTYPVGTGQGPSFDTLGIEVGTMTGFARKPATKTG